MDKYLLNVTTIQQSHKIQLIKEIREKWGEDMTEPGRKIAFYEDDDGKIILEPAGKPSETDD